MSPLKSLFHVHFQPLFLSVAASLLLVGLMGGCSAEAGAELSAPEASQAVAEQRLTLIDVRTPDEWRETGVAPGALRIDMNHPGGKQGFIDAVLHAVDGNKNAPIGLICRTGNRSGVVQRALLEAGFTDVANISEGMVGSRAGPGWLRRGLPVEACRQC
ncbi:molybdopterin biosynthesis protein MoeB [Thiorhodovibrio winogradskyi]|uniref:Molybdopterin biosynthesis protein MoeB n=1 Tax=Thiorhodovibrio winogradskyi TaxID=77007 RepID=A0ABZ0SJP0_9GAMM